MLAAIRTFAKSWVAVVLIGLLIVSFAVFGISDIFRNPPGDAVIRVGSRTISSADFKREFDAYKGKLEQQAGQPISVQLAAENGVDHRVLDGVANREAFAELLHKIGIRPSDKLLGEQLRDFPAFFNQVSGKFDEAIFKQRLQENGLTPDRFEQGLRDEMAGQHVGTAMLAGLKVPRAYAALAAIYGLEQRDVSYFMVDPTHMPPPAPPTDAQLTAFMQENAERLRLPEFRVLTVVSFSPAAQAAGVAIDPAELKKRYEFKKDTLSTPETRTVIQIPAKDQATAQQIAARLAKGEAPAAIAKSLGVDAITYAARPKSAIPDRKVAEAAFAMTVGQVAPVQGDIGAAVVKVETIAPGHLVTLEEARPQIEAEIRKDAAAEKVSALTEAYDAAHESGASLTEAAQKAGVPAVTIGPVSPQGRDQQGAPVMGLNAKLMETAFELPAGGESEIQETGEREYFAVRVDRIIPAAMPPLAQVKPQLVRVWMMREFAKRLKAKADELAARVRKGESLDAVATSFGARVAKIPAVTRPTSAQSIQVSEDTLDKAFATRSGDSFVAEGAQFGFVVGKVDAIRAGDRANIAALVEQARPQMSLSVFREIDEAARAAARTEMKVKTDANKARVAIGLEPLEAVPQSKTATKK